MDNKTLLTGLETMYDIPFVSNLKRVLSKYPDANLNDALSQGQIKSKQWLIEELANITTEPGMTFILGGWYGTLAAMMLESGQFDEIKIRSFDIDLRCANIADTMNRTPWVLNNSWQFKASTADMFDLDYSLTKHTTFRADGSCITLEEESKTIINTSCEHVNFEEWLGLIPKGKQVVLQSNNYFSAPDHINCMKSLEEFKEKANLTEVQYAGTLELEKYNRFMIIGLK